MGKPTDRSVQQQPGAAALRCIAEGGEWIVAGAAVRVSALRDGQIHVRTVDAPP